MRLSPAFAASTFVLAVVVAACTGGGGSTAGPSAASTTCADAKSAAESCNRSDGGITITNTFDEKGCEQLGEQGQKIAECMIANKARCDCMLTCVISGSCP